jgi:hypothetical protein
MIIKRQYLKVVKIIGINMTITMIMITMIITFIIMTISIIMIIHITITIIMGTIIIIMERPKRRVVVVRLQKCLVTKMEEMQWGTLTNTLDLYLMQSIKGVYLK